VRGVYEAVVGALRHELEEAAPVFEPRAVATI